MQGMRQDMDVRVRPVDERTIHPDFAFRVHDQADYSSGFEEGSSKPAADATREGGGLSCLVMMQADISGDESGKTMGGVRRHMFDSQSELVLIGPPH